MKLPTPASLADEFCCSRILQKSDLVDMFLKYAERVREACIEAVEDSGGDNAHYHAAAIRKLDLTGQ